MRTYDEIFAIAAERHGGSEALEERLREQPRGDPRAMTEDRWLAGFTRGVFQAGFSWKVIEAKWDGFEAAFRGFDIDACAMMNDDWLDELLRDERIVRNGTKILAVRANAVMLRDMREQGGATKVITGWSPRDFIGLLALLKAKGNRLGGTSGQYALRFAGVDSFILSRDVVGRLVAEGVVDKAPTSKKGLAATQAAFNVWMDQSGRSLTQVSRTLALSL